MRPQLFDKDIVNNAVIWSPAVRNAMDSRALSSDLLKVYVHSDGSMVTVASV